MYGSIDILMRGGEDERLEIGERRIPDILACQRPARSLR
jgi:hypothetical protein